MSNDLTVLDEKLHKLVDDLLKGKDIHNLLLGLQSGDAQFKWAGAAGIAVPETGASMQPDTPFFIASVTKMYTAAAVMLLKESGKLKLDDKIQEYLPEELIAGLHRYQGVDYTQSITIRHLVSHTSGIADYFLQKPKGGQNFMERLLKEGDLEWDPAGAVRIATEDLEPNFPPADFSNAQGQPLKASYSDTNYQLLGVIIEAAAGAPLHQVFEQFFFAPLELNQTYLYGYPREQISEAKEPAHLFYKQREMRLDKAMKSFWADGGIVSTLDDSLRFIQAFMSGGLFQNPQTLPDMMHWNKIFFPMEYGYGLMRFKLPWFMSPFNPSPEMIGHSGSTGAFLYYAHELDLYLAGTINQSASQSAPFRLMLKAAQLYKKERA
jgi:CubicO group peptidase (beta-lactamase class C family)